MGLNQYLIYSVGVTLRVGLYAHTAQALATRPVSAAIPNASV
jgi:hypothetical protein